MKINCFLSLASVMILSFLINSCAAAPDLSDSQGVCSLQCSNAKIGSSNMRVRFLSENMQISCSGIADNEAYIGTVPIRFAFERPLIKLPAEDIPAAGGASEDKPEKFNDKGGLPASGISFEPIVVSGYLGPTNTSDPRFKYKGIVTGLDEWCTDSCGIGTIDIVPLCKSINNIVTLMIRSGSVSNSIQVTVTP